MEKNNVKRIKQTAISSKKICMIGENFYAVICENFYAIFQHEKFKKQK